MTVEYSLEPRKISISWLPGGERQAQGYAVIFGYEDGTKGGALYNPNSEDMRFLDAHLKTASSQLGLSVKDLKERLKAGETITFSAKSQPIGP